MTIRVLHVTTVPMTLRFLRGQAGFLRTRGIELEFASSGGPELTRFSTDAGVPAHPVEMRRAISPGPDLVALAKLVAVIRRVKPDIVHAHTPKGGLLGTTAASLAGVKARIYHLRGLRYEGDEGWRRRLLCEAERSTCSMATQVISVSHSIRKRIVADGLCPSSKIRVLANGSGQGVDSLGVFNPERVSSTARSEFRKTHGLTDRDWVALFVGRLANDKGIRELLAAWRIVVERAPRARLCIVGPVEDVDPSVLRSAERLSETVRLAGPHRNIEQVYPAADVLVLPTYREGFSNVLLEAAAMGVPRIASAVDGCTDAVEDGQTGALVPPRDAAALAAAILHYYEDPTTATRHAEAARADVVARFQPQAIWHALADLYEEVTAAST